MNKKSFVAVLAVIVVATGLGLGGIIKLARASHAVPVPTIDKGTDTAIVEGMRSCIVTVSTQGLTNAGIDQAYRLCWNRAELIGKTHKGK